MKINDPKFYGTVKDYLTIYLPSQKECSPNTIKSYREGLNMFLSYLADSQKMRIYQVGFKDMVPERMVNFTKWLAENRQCSNNTINQRIAIIRSFLQCYNSQFGGFHSLPNCS